LPALPVLPVFERVLPVLRFLPVFSSTSFSCVLQSPALTQSLKPLNCDKAPQSGYCHHPLNPKALNMYIRYFAWVKSRLGVAQEQLSSLPQTVKTLADLVDFLSARGGLYAEVFGKERHLLRGAVNQHLAPWHAPVKLGDEIALFPPITGG
jgi:sulfur-carrier protein